MTPTPSAPERFEPHAAREMASMFDDVSGRYDLLNRLMTLGQDGEWRAELAAAVPPRAITVLDLCTGNGVSLRGLTRPGRLVVGLDVSLGMLEEAAAMLPVTGWAPRLVGGDAFHLPFADATIEAITIGFGVRNLRPRAGALAEMRRVLAPGGVLAVLEACAPRPGAFAPFHRFHLRRVVPLLGRLSPDPSAYRYLSESIFEFGDGRAFEADLAATGFTLVATRSFLLGATRLWVARAPGAAEPAVQDARSRGGERGESPHAVNGRESGAGGWRSVQLVVSAVLTIALGAGLIQFARTAKNLPLAGWTRLALGGLLGLGLLVFLARTLLLAARRRGPRPRR